MNGQDVAAAVGQQFTVRLQSTPSTGYLWEVRQLPPTIQLVGSDYEKAAENPAPGDPGAQVFRFQATQTGAYTITFILKRRWESAGIESLTVKVTIS